MNRVNPPEQIQLPETNNKGLLSFLEQLKFVVFQLWKRTGAGADWVGETRTGLYEFDDIVSAILSLASKNDDVVVTSADYTTITNQTVVCTDSVIVYLNNNPNDRERAKVIVTNGDVTINGNGKKINKEDFQKVIFKNLVTLATVDCVYVVETDEWFIV